VPVPMMVSCGQGCLAKLGLASEVLLRATDSATARQLTDHVTDSATVRRQTQLAASARTRTTSSCWANQHRCQRRLRCHRLIHRRMVYQMALASSPNPSPNLEQTLEQMWTTSTARWGRAPAVDRCHRPARRHAWAAEGIQRQPEPARKDCRRHTRAGSRVRAVATSPGNVTRPRAAMTVAAMQSRSVQAGRTTTAMSKECRILRQRTHRRALAA
jgi:hypothetical protein